MEKEDIISDMNNKSLTPLQKLKVAALQLSKIVAANVSIEKEVASISLNSQNYQLINRLKQLPLFKDKSDEEIKSFFPTITLQHCREVIALENDCKSWYELCIKYRKLDNSSPDEESLWYVHDNNSGLNIWFAKYEKAKQYLKTSQRGFLFPYKKTYFVADHQHVIKLGVDPLDPDWEKIGRDWVEPQDEIAKKSLWDKLVKAQKTRNERKK